MKLKQVLGITLFTFVLGLSFASCNDDDDDDPAAPEITGTWKYDRVMAIVEVTDPEIEQSVIDYIENLPNDDIDTYVFSVDYTFKAKLTGENGGEISGKYQYENGNIYFLDEKSFSLVFDNNTISRVQNVKDMVLEALDLTEEQVTEAKAERIFERITK